MQVLISGGGIAGNALALGLAAKGIRPTVVERAAAPRPGGQAVDLRGRSRAVVERMGLLPAIRERRLHERGMAYVDAQRKVYARMPAEMFDGAGPVADLEITRGDLNDVLLGALGDRADYRYGESIAALHDDGAGVDVTFASGRRARYDLVVAADGLHSATRALAFGPEERYTTHLGGAMSFFTIPTPADAEPGWFSLHPAVGVTAGIRPDADPATAKAIVMLRTPADQALRGDAEAQRALVRRALTGVSGHAPQILAALPDTPDFYFDELVRVDMPSLSAGRVTLLGDAGYCGSPLTGMGTAMAVVGAYVLCGELTATPDDIPAALARTERVLTPYLERAKQVPGGGIRAMVPGSKATARLARAAAGVMTSRVARPLVHRMFTGTEETAVPVY
ncbi:FAD-dependent monooxygenase [Nocardia sp. NPDC050697]|uniref:FAD-dependent monooxygenase n=1 Tax=Nocardia sp. NPDC050697 TaxID=3155158 RepID=UPI0034047BF4